MFDKKTTIKFMGAPEFSIEKSRAVRKWLLETFADEKNLEVQISLLDVIGSLIIKEKAAVEEVETDLF